MVLPTDFEFTLPRGYLDQAGILHRNGAMRLAKAADEIAPQQDARVRRNPSYFAVLLLSRVITRLGTLEASEIGPGVVEQLFTTDLAFLQGFYRHINQAVSTGIDTRCPACGSPFRVDVGSGDAGTPSQAGSL